MLRCRNDECYLLLGGGIKQSNLQRILQETSAKEFHASLRVTNPSGMLHKNTTVGMGASLSASEYQLKTTSSEKVQDILELARECTV